MIDRAPARRILLAVLALAAAAPAAAGAAQGATVRFSFLPARVTQGQPVSVAVFVRPAGARCTVDVRYADGFHQAGLEPARAVRGRAAWKWQVSRSAAPGKAEVTVGCRGAGRLTRSLQVLAGPGLAARITVEKQGFSQRPEPFGGLSVSYGVVLANPATDKDALNVDVLVNAVDGANVVQNSATTRIPAIAAGGSYFLGGSMPVASPVTRLEVVVRSASSDPKSAHFPPIDDVRIGEAKFDPGYVGAVAGQVLNDHSLLLAGSKLSIVVFDAAGHPIGGGTGFVIGPLYPGARMYFSAFSGFKAIPFAQAAAAQVSIDPSWRPVP